MIKTYCRHLHGTADAPGFLKYRPELGSNRDGAGTAFTTSFTRANSFLDAPVAHSHHSSEKDEESRRLAAGVQCLSW